MQTVQQHPGALQGALRRIKRHHLLTLARNVLSYSYSKRYLGSYPITCHALHFIWPRTWQQTWLLASQSKTTFSATLARVLIWEDFNVGTWRSKEKNEWTVPPTEDKHLVQHHGQEVVGIAGRVKSRALNPPFVWVIVLPVHVLLSNGKQNRKKRQEDTVHPQPL